MDIFIYGLERFWSTRPIILVKYMETTKRILSKEQPKSYLFRQKMERQLYTSWVGNISTGKSLAFQETWIPEWEKRIFVYKWTYLSMYLEDILVILLYKWTFLFMDLEDIIVKIWYHKMGIGWRKKILNWESEEDDNQHV